MATCSTCAAFRKSTDTSLPEAMLRNGATFANGNPGPLYEIGRIITFRKQTASP